MSSAHRYLPNYTVSDYASWQGDWELWDGIPVSMTPSPFGPHQNVCLNLAVLLKRSIAESGCKAVVLAEIDWVISENTVVRPDLVVLCGDVPRRHVESCPAIVAEVLSASTANRDRNSKLELYREQAVPYYMIVDPEDRTLTVLELDAGKTFREMDLTRELSLRICDICTLDLDVKQIFS